MKKAGGIIALIAGIFATGAALATLFFGGLGAALGGDGAEVIMGMGFAGIVLSFMTIILGAIAIGKQGGLYTGIILVLCAIGGSIGSGPFVMVPMILAAVGGILVIIGRDRFDSTG